MVNSFLLIKQVGVERRWRRIYKTKTDIDIGIGIGIDWYWYQRRNESCKKYLKFLIFSFLSIIQANNSKVPITNILCIPYTIDSRTTHLTEIECHFSLLGIMAIEYRVGRSVRVEECKIERV